MNNKCKCKTCYWYKRDNAPYTCSCPKMVYGYNDCDVETDGVAIENDEAWGMEPQPDFGCIHHEPKKTLKAR